MKRFLSVLALCWALLLNSPKEINAESDLHIGLFPEQPIYKTIMADPDISKTEIKVSQGLEKEILGKPTGKILPYISLAKTLPLASLDISNKRLLSSMPKTAIGNGELSDKVISTSLVATGELTFPQNQENDIDYKTRLELFLNSPMVDTCLSDGNRFYIVGGFSGQGSTKSNELPNKTLSQIAKSFIDTYSFSGDVYIVPKSPYSDQYLILRVGMDNLFGNVSEKPNVHISTTWEFPPLFHWLKIFENFKFSPYVSTHVQLPTDSEKSTTALGQIGIKASGESKKSLFLYTQANYNGPEPWTFYSGLKAKL